MASLLEMGLANVEDGAVRIPYQNFPEIEAEEFRLTTAFAAPSPFLLKIDRTSDIGRPDFRYRYQYVLGAVPVPLQRFGFYVKRAATGEVFRLDERMYSLLEAMDAFNALAPEEKGPQRSWLDFANIKRWSHEVNAALDATLSKNDVMVPSSIGLDLYEDPEVPSASSPPVPSLITEASGLSLTETVMSKGSIRLDQPGMGKLRIVLTDKQRTGAGADEAGAPCDGRGQAKAERRPAAHLRRRDRRCGTSLRGKGHRNRNIRVCSDPQSKP